MILFLRPKEVLSWIVPGYVHPYENCLIHKHSCEVLYLEDVISDFSLLSKVEHIYALSAIPVLQTGSEFWSLVSKKNIPVSCWKETLPLLRGLVNVVPIGVTSDLIIESASLEKHRFNQFRADASADYPSILRNAYIYSQYIVFKPVGVTFMDIIPENVITFSEDGWSPDRGYFIGTFDMFYRNFLPQLQEKSVGVQKIKAYISFFPETTQIDSKKGVLDRYFEVMDSVKKSLKLNLYFSGYGSEISYFLNFRMKGVKVEVSDDFHYRVQEARLKVMCSRTFPDRLPVTKTFLLRGK